MTNTPAQELDLDGLDPWADGDHAASLPSASSSAAPALTDGDKERQTDDAKRSTDGAAPSRDGSSTSIKVPIPRPFRTAPLTAPLSSLKGKERPKQAPGVTAAFESPRAASPVHPSAYDPAHLPTFISPGSETSFTPSRSQSHPLAIDHLATQTASLSLDEDDYSYGAYARTTAVMSATHVHSRHRTPINRSRSGSAASPYRELDIRDVTRPALNRMTSETERQLSIGSWSAASSDTGNGQTEEEIDYIVHTVTPSDSLPGISLRYGIDLASLRKANRLWPADPIHLRTEVYIPIDDCRPSAAGDHVERDIDGRTVLVRRRASHGHDASPDGVASSSASAATISPPDEVLTVVRLPKSKMRFFPKSASSRPRRSLDLDIGRSADNVRLLAGSERAKKVVRHRPVDGLLPRSSTEPSTPTNGSFLRSPSKNKASKASGSGTRNVVRLRPPTSAPPPPAHATLASRLTQLFNVPPPPAHQQPAIIIPRDTRQEDTLPPDLPPELVEMDARPVDNLSPRKNRPAANKKRD